MGLNRDVVIFGASGGALKVARTLIDLGYDFLFFVDNDSKKWGNTVEGKEVKAPQELVNGDYRILIASDYQAEIEKQLDEMQLLDRLILKEELILEYFRKKESPISIPPVKADEKSDKRVVIELADAGICLGGIETWALMVCRDLLARKHKVTLITRETEQVIPEDIKDITDVINYDYDRYHESVEETAEKLMSMLPCTVISNWQSQVMVAAILVKRLCPEQITIISVVHNDKIALYRRQAYLAEYTDFIFCVSRKIKRVFEEKFGISPQKLIYKESPVRSTEFVKQYATDPECPIRIGFAARISKYQKRADLLCRVIQELNQRNVKYTMEIAGDGTYFPKLREGVEGAAENVKLLGCIPRDHIEAFWKSKDIFISVSDFEGASLSMLEAMSYGAVPVVTMVSGVDEFVENGVNGCVREVGDWLGIADSIQELAQDREKLVRFGVKSRQIVFEKCKEDDYIDVIERLL